MKQQVFVPPSENGTIVEVDTVITMQAVEGNKPPVVNAGSNAIIVLPISEISLLGSASDPDGSIASVLWSKISGSGTIMNNTQNSTKVTGLTEGISTFKFEAVDNKGAKSESIVQITVKAAVIIVDPPPPVGGFGTLLYKSGFNNQSELGQNLSQLGRGGISTDVFKTGPGSFRSEVRANDPSLSDGYRSEIQYDGSQFNPKEPVVIYDAYYQNWKAHGWGGHSVQWHPSKPDGASAVLGLYTHDGKFQVFRSPTGSTVAQTAPQGGGTLWTITPNKWYRHRWEIKWASDNTGYVRLFLDDVLYYSASNVATTNQFGVPYFKLGQNRWSSLGQTTVIFYDNLEIYSK